MTIKETLAANPMTWKDWVGWVTLLLTVATVFVQGGRILEKMEVTNRNVEQMQGQIVNLQERQIGFHSEIVSQRGADRLHDEQITGLRRDVNLLMGLKGK